MALEHLVVHKSSDYLCAFPDIIRLHNGDLVTVFRESAIHPPNRNPERPQDAKITHISPWGPPFRRRSWWATPARWLSMGARGHSV